MLLFIRASCAVQIAVQAAKTTFGAAPYVAVHVRRDGYEHYCNSTITDQASARRFGMRVAPEACFPSVSQIAEAVNAVQLSHGIQRVLLATNSQDESEIKQVSAAYVVNVLDRRCTYQYQSIFRTVFSHGVELLSTDASSAFL